MRERGILFSAPMVRALLAGAKTQTRRIVKPQPELVPDDKRDVIRSEWWWSSRLHQSMILLPEEQAVMESVCPYGAAGDRMWVRETFALVNRLSGAEMRTGREDDESGVRYRATWEKVHSLAWRPSIFMPRWASRITLEVTGIRVERLQVITEADAKAEGVRPFFEVYEHIGRDQRLCTGELARDAPYRASYACLWDEINGERALWVTNPWVWVVEFKPVATP